MIKASITVSIDENISIAHDGEMHEIESIKLRAPKIQDGAIMGQIQTLATKAFFGASKLLSDSDDKKKKKSDDDAKEKEKSDDDETTAESIMLLLTLSDDFEKIYTLFHQVLKKVAVICTKTGHNLNYKSNYLDEGSLDLYREIMGEYFISFLLPSALKGE